MKNDVAPMNPSPNTESLDSRSWYGSLGRQTLLLHYSSRLLRQESEYSQ